MFMLKSSVLVFIFAFFSLASNEADFEMRFATKSPYFFRELTNINYDGFKPIKVWAIYRHGTRLPAKKTISKYSGLAEYVDQLQNSTYLTGEEKLVFKNWKPLPISLQEQKFLTKEGEEELFELGSRFRHQFLNYFDLNEAKFTFKHTPTQRTNLSAKYFMQGLFQSTNLSHEATEVARDDPILRPYKGCPLWRKNVKKNPATLAEKTALKQSIHVENLINEMRDITQIKDLDLKDIELLYTACGFETAWRRSLHNGKSIWCTLFKNQRHIALLEYLEDMKYYWIDGPGFEITRKVACQTVNDMINQLDPSTIDQSLSFYFTHSGTILKLLTFLGLYKDDFQLTADRFNHERLWRTSQIDTFATNIVAVLYDSKLYGPHVQLLHQEKIVEIPGCVSNQFGMCSYENFKNIYDEKIKNCNLSSICHEKDEL